MGDPILKMISSFMNSSQISYLEISE